MVCIAAFDSLYFRISNLYQGQCTEQKRWKMRNILIEHFLFQISLGANTIQK